MKKSKKINLPETKGEKKDKLQKKKKKTPLKPQFEEIHYIDTTKPAWNYSLLTDEEVVNFRNGTHYRLYEKFGSHAISVNDIHGMYFCVWAPNATSVSVIGNFNQWKNNEHELYPRWDKSGVWEGFIPHLNYGEVYKYHIVGFKDREVDKGDP